MQTGRGSIEEIDREDLEAFVGPDEPEKQEHRALRGEAQLHTRFLARHRRSEDVIDGVNDLPDRRFYPQRCKVVRHSLRHDDTAIRPLQERPTQVQVARAAFVRDGVVHNHEDLRPSTLDLPRNPP